MNTKEKLRIANNNELFDEENSTWIGKLIRKGKKKGKVVRDQNGRFRVLTVEFRDGTIEKITLSNLGADDESVHQYDWLSGETWYTF